MADEVQADTEQRSCKKIVPVISIATPRALREESREETEQRAYEDIMHLWKLYGHPQKNFAETHF